MIKALKYLALFVVGSFALFIVIGLSSDSKIPKAKRAVEFLLKDPDSAEFRSVRESAKRYVCGEVNAKNSFGAYTGFRRFAVDVSESGTVPSIDLGGVSPNAKGAERAAQLGQQASFDDLWRKCMYGS
jgi:hypothetical protein